MKKKVVSVFLTAAMAASVFAGCGNSAANNTGAEATTEEKEGDTVQSGSGEAATAVDDAALDGTTISFWHSMGGVNGEALQTLVDQFNEENEYGRASCRERV